MTLARFGRIYRWCLRLYPAEFRRQFGEEMGLIVEEQLEAAAEGGWPNVLSVCARELGGLLSQGVRERVDALRARPEGIAQTNSGPRYLVSARRWPKLVYVVLAVSLLIVVGLVLLPAAVQFVWQYSENAPKVNQVALADLDSDGDLDAFLAVGRGSMPFPAYALYNDGARQLSEKTQRLGKWPGFSVALGDVNGDGLADALLDITAGGIVQYLNGGGVFRHQGSLAEPGPKGVMRLVPVIADLNGDGRLDVFAAGCCGRPPGESPDTVANPYQPPYSQVWLQTAEGRLRAGQQVGDAPSRAAALADVDGDGHLDVLLANGPLLGDDWKAGPPQPNTVWLNDGQGNFRDSGQRLGEAESWAAALGDLNGDGSADAVVGNRGPDEVWLNDGRGFFSDSGQRLGSGLTEEVFLADLDGDGDLDLLAASETQGRAWFNDGHGQFEPGRQRLRYSPDAAVTVGDLTGDGMADVLVAGVATTQVWRNDGSGRFSAGPSVRYR